MSFWPFPAGLRIGAVSYLNTRPLIWGWDSARLVLDVPARLSGQFAAGQLDVALLPVFEILREGGGVVADDVAIACRGEVYSVIVASRCAFEECGEIFLDPASQSSSALLRVLVAEYYPHLTVREGKPAPDGARLLIGDPAIAFRRTRGTGWKYHDLGELWMRRTGLPFVFAAWALAPGLAHPEEIAGLLRRAKMQGAASRDAIATGEQDPGFALDYLTRHIRYDIGPEEKKAVEKFAALAERHGLIPQPAALSYL